ncbi:3-phosphoshikimate 1-carboxyvinyltransferase [bacterium]|nr:3-phosphoshikimate 1-carboxyvinyltransferase [candidate division CSSED10-310 bacterium]
MSTLLYSARGPLRGELRPPGDKSISHRALLCAALAEGRSDIRNLLRSEDVDRSRRLVEALGVTVAREAELTIVISPGRDGLTAPEAVIDCGNSGTTMRLGTGLVAALPFVTRLTGDESLLRRPMRRIIEPLAEMGISVESRNGGLPPLAVHGGVPNGICYKLKIASAQVKSAILLAGLGARSPVTVEEPVRCRDHTERLLASLGAGIGRRGDFITMVPCRRLMPLHLTVPGDISSAAFFICAAAIVPGSRLRLAGVGINPTRTGFIDVLRRMGAGITYEQPRLMGGEPVADLLVEYGPLRGVTVAAGEIPGFIDEVGLAALAATQARGTTILDGLAELRIKESDRLEAIREVLESMGAMIEITRDDGLRIQGPVELRGATLAVRGDHRMAMLGAVASLAAAGGCTIDDPEVVAVSYPNFFADLAHLV